MLTILLTTKDLALLGAIFNFCGMRLTGDPDARIAGLVMTMMEPEVKKLYVGIFNQAKVQGLELPDAIWKQVDHFEQKLKEAEGEAPQRDA